VNVAIHDTNFNGIVAATSREFEIVSAILPSFNTFARLARPGTDVRGAYAYHITRSNFTPFHEVSMPFYSQTSRQAVSRPSVPSTTLVGRPVLAVANRQINTGGVTDTNFRFETFVGGDDDFSFGYLIGPSPILYSNRPDTL